MAGLRADCFRGRLTQGRILFERFVVRFYFPPFLVNYCHLFPAQTRIAADQIEHSLRPILVCKDLSDDEYGLFEAP